MRGFVAVCLGMMVCGLLPAPVRADRVVLSPEGDTLAPNGFKTEFIAGPGKGPDNLSWLQFSTPQGIELEAQRQDLETDSKKRYAVNVEYPLVPEIRGVPAVSVGIRDLLGTGTEHGALYLAATRAFPLSRNQARLLREMRWNVGIGTGRVGGPFLGLEAHLKAGVSLYAELYRHRPNFGIALPLVRNLQARAYSLDGDIFYGVSFTWAH